MKIPYESLEEIVKEALKMFLPENQGMCSGGNAGWTVINPFRNTWLNLCKVSPIEQFLKAILEKNMKGIV